MVLKIRFHQISAFYTTQTNVSLTPKRNRRPGRQMSSFGRGMQGRHTQGVGVDFPLRQLWDDFVPVGNGSETSNLIPTWVKIMTFGKKCQKGPIQLAQSGVGKKPNQHVAGFRPPFKTCNATRQWINGCYSYWYMRRIATPSSLIHDCARCYTTPLF